MNAQSTLLSIVLGGVLGALRTPNNVQGQARDRHTVPIVCGESRALQGFQTETRELLGGAAENIVPLRGH